MGKVHPAGRWPAGFFAAQEGMAKNFWRCCPWIMKEVQGVLKQEAGVYKPGHFPIYIGFAQ
jgi:hypothetical protein